MVAVDKSPLCYSGLKIDAMEAAAGPPDGLGSPAASPPSAGAASATSAPAGQFFLQSRDLASGRRQNIAELRGGGIEMAAAWRSARQSAHRFRDASPMRRRPASVVERPADCHINRTMRGGVTA